MSTRKMLFIALIGLAAGAFADEWDPGDNTASGGTLLTPTASVQYHEPHTLTAPTDLYDFFKISMTAGKEYVFESRGESDTYAELYNSTSTNSQYRVDYDDDSGENRNFRLTYTPTVSRTYYLRVRTIPVGNNAKYSLIYSYTPAPDQCDSGDDEPTGATALTPTASSRFHGPHTLTAMDKYDFFKFSLTAGKEYVFESAGSADTVGELYNSASTNSQYRVAANDDDGEGLNFRLVYTPTVSQTYYLRVRTAVTVGRNASYSLMYSYTPAPDQWDSGDDEPAGATALTPTASATSHGSHTLTATDKYDFFKISMTAGTEYVLETDGSADTYGELYNSTSTNSQYRVASNDDGGDNYNFRLAYTPTVSKTYYLRVKTAVSVGRNAQYTLKYSYTPDPDKWDSGDDEPTGATALTPLKNVQSHGLHTLTAADKYDFFKISMTAGREYVLESTGSGDTFGELYSSPSTNSQYRVASNNDSGTGDNFKITYTPTVSQTYYLRVRTAVAVGRNAAYSLVYSYTPDPDKWDSGDNTASGATTITPTSNSSLSDPHTLTAADKYDFFKIAMEAGREYLLESTGSSDTYGALYSSTSVDSKYCVAASDNDGDGYNFKIAYTPTVSKTYYLRVRTATLGSNAQYRLRYSYTPDPDQWDSGDDLSSGATMLTPAGASKMHGWHTLTATDKYDFFKISMTAGIEYVLESTGTADTYGELYNSTSTNSQYLVAEDDGSGSINNFKIAYTPTVSQTYYLRVRTAVAVGRNASYALWYSYTPDPDAWDSDDDLGSGATTLTPTISRKTHGPHTLTATDKYDFFEIWMEAGKKYVFESTGDSDMYGELYNSTSTNSQYRVAYNDDGGEGSNFKLTYTPTVSQTYYLRVRANVVGRNAVYNLRHSYTFDPDQWDPGDNEPAGAEQLSPTTDEQTTAPHTLTTSDHYDFFAFAMTAGKTYVLESTGSSDTYGELYSSTSIDSQHLVAEDDDSGDKNNFKIEYTPAVSQTYYLRVRTIPLGQVGKYSLKYSHSEPTSVSVTFDAQGGTFSNGAATKTVEAKPGNLWGKLPMPSKSGQVFDGWYTAASGGEIVTASSEVPAGSATYYAHWTPRLGLAAASEWSGEFQTDSWCGQGTVSYDGKDALRSGIVYDNQSSYLITKVSGPGVLTFWWAVSCEAGGKDALRLLVDGAQIDMISGEVDWKKVEVEIPGTGTHTIKWNYTKNGSVTKGEDFGWVDKISWVSTPSENAFVFDANGGKFSNGASVKKTDATPGNLWGKMYMPAKDGQVFVGWFTAKEGGTQVTSSSVVPNYYCTYYARWTPRLGLAAASEWPYEFTTDSWCGQGAVSHDGKDALRTGIIYDNQSSYLITRVTGSGTLTFWWKVSCEAGGNDALRFLVDGSQKYSISGEKDWAKVTVSITGSGTHVLKWNYTKNGSVSKGQDFGWIDQISWQAK